MTLTQLEYILALDKHRHFHNAAKACSVTQPTLSQQISKLEKELGIYIFDRSKSPLIPTVEGKKVLKKARKMILLGNEITDMDFHQESLTGTFTLGIIPTLASYLIPLFSKKFAETYPHVSLKIEELKTEEIILHLENDTIDGALLVTPLQHSFINEQVLYYEELHFFCDSKHTLKQKSSIDPLKIKSSDLWLLEQGHCFRDQTLNLCGLTKMEEESGAAFNYQPGNISTLIKIVEEFGGLTLLPEMSLEDLNKTQRETQILKVKGALPTREVSFVHSRLFEKEALYNALLNCIRHCLPKKLQTRKKPKRIIPIS